MAVEFRKPGEFCWINMLTPEPEAAREFFSSMLGWTYFEMPGIGHGIKVAGRNIGGLFDLNGPNTPAGLAPIIGVMVKVDNADDTCARVKSLGGTAKPAFAVGGQGRMAVCNDPNRAEFDVWESKAMQGTDVDPNLPGAPSWFETMTTDSDRASAFYSDLFGWTSESSLMDGHAYTTFRQGTVAVAGMRSIPSGMDNVRPDWRTYFTVDDADRAEREAVNLGASIIVPATDLPGVGRYCGIRSPQGVKFYAIAYFLAGDATSEAGGSSTSRLAGPV
jgi:predicted enzyme related to lactoylglutathione lyase